MDTHDFSIVKLGKENILSFDGILPYDMSKHITKPGHYGLGLLDGNKACGVMMMFYDENEEALESYFMYVDENYRRSGGGSLMLKELESYAISLGGKRVSVRYSLPGDMKYENFLFDNGYMDITPVSEAYRIRGSVLKDYVEEQLMDPKSILVRSQKKLNKSKTIKIVPMDQATVEQQRLWRQHFSDNTYPEYLSPGNMTGTIEEATSVLLIDSDDVVGFTYTCVYGDGVRNLAGAYVPEKYRFFGGVQMIMHTLANLEKKMKDKDEVFLSSVNEQSRRMIRELLPDELKEKVEVERMYAAQKQMTPDSFEITATDLVLPRINGINDALTDLGFNSTVELDEDGVPEVIVDDEGFPPITFSYLEFNPETLDEFLLSISAAMEVEDPTVLMSMIGNYNALMLYVQALWDEENGQVIFSAYQPEDVRLSSYGAIAVMIGEFERAIVKFEQMYAAAGKEG